MRKKKLLLTGTGLLSPRVFADRLYANKLLAPRADHSVDVALDFDAIEVSFRSLGVKRPRFPVSTLAILALLIRRVAETGRRVELILPAPYHGRRSSLQQLLAHLAFVDLFRDPRHSWTANVALQGTTGVVRHDELPGGTHYLPFRWFDRSWFSYENRSSPYLHVPKVGGSFERALAGALVAQGFIDQDAIDLFVHVMFLEIAWNTVLHATSPPGNGYGIVGAQVEVSSPDGRQDLRAFELRTLHFCIADFGLGIPHTLGPYYGGTAPDYEADLDCSKASAIVRYAIDPTSTSRPPDGFPDST